MKYLSLVLYLLSALAGLNAQEFLATVAVQAPNIQIADPKLFENMEKQITDFVNSTQWTDVNYDPEERIELSIQINLMEERSDKDFVVNFSIQALRPTFNSDYKTSLITHADNAVQIEYIPFMQLRNSRSGYFNNLSSLLSFYCYMILGMDYDSFVPLGGDPHFAQCKLIASGVPQSVVSVDKGWQDIRSTRSRFRLLEDIQSPAMRPYRESYYNYHRHALDKMYEDPETSVAVIVSAIEAIGAINRNVPNAQLLQVFCNTKRDEIVEILKAGNVNQRNTVYQIMSQVDPASISKYRLLKS